MSVSTLARVPVKPFPWRTIGALALLALLLAAVAAAYVGSRPRLPAPFGPASNGLVAYAEGGDIFAIDPATATRYTISSGPDEDSHPRWSLDGTRLAFLRVSSNGVDVVAADAGGTNQRVLTSNPLVSADPDSIAWSPDGRTIAIVGGPGRPGIYLIEADDGGVTRLPIAVLHTEVFWRPPDGRQLLFLAGTTAALGLFTYSLSDGAVEQISLPGPDRSDLRPLGWTPDGSGVVYQEPNTFGEPWTHVLGVDTGSETIVRVGFAQLSNDGTRLMGQNWDDAGRTWLCVASVAGGDCSRITANDEGGWGDHYRWSPDDEWIITTRSDDATFVLDPDGVVDAQPSWLDGGAESWQRIAP